VSSDGTLLGMEPGVSLPDEDVAFLDAYARSRRMPSRSAALQRAVKLLRPSQLEGAYADAWQDWAAGSDAVLWDAMAADA
jgi:Arc/MetJ-type ribon-helix-helix transcriptional regulator